MKMNHPNIVRCFSYWIEENPEKSKIKLFSNLKNLINITT